jgi:hypothetical protein
MTNREKYLFEDFTFTNYRRLIKLAKKQGFHFILHKDDFVPERKDVIWRHDVEFSPDKALKMAEIENEEGVQATYFWQLHTNYYNTVSVYFMDILHKISSLGHHIGLHFDSHFWNIQSEEELEDKIRLDAQYLETAIGGGIKLDTFSFHNTNSFVLSCKEKKYGGLLNVYSSYFKERYDYCGDSTGIWRFDRLEDCLLNPKIHHLQVLTHDGMWSEKAISPHLRIMTSIQREADRKKLSYATKLPLSGNINVGEYNINPGIDEL